MKVQFAPLVLAVSALLLVTGAWPEWARNVAIVIILFTLCILAGLFERRAWAPWAEYLRLALIASSGLALWINGGLAAAWCVLIVFAALTSLFAFIGVNRHQSPV